MRRLEEKGVTGVTPSKISVLDGTNPVTPAMTPVTPIDVTPPNPLEQVEEAGFKGLTEAVNTTPPAGRTMMQVVGAFAGFERACIEPFGSAKEPRWHIRPYSLERSLLSCKKLSV